MLAKIQNNYWPLSFVLLVVLVAVGISFYVDFSAYPIHLANAITADLAITAPVLYFFLIRKSSIPNLTVVPFFIIGLLIAHTVVPTTDRQLLTYLTNYVLPTIELFVLLLISRNIWRFVVALRQNGANTVDKLELLRRSTTAVLGEGLAARVFTMELSVIYYGLLSWRKRIKQSEQHWIDEDGVHLRYGLAGNADLPMHLIKKIQLTSRTPREPKKFTKLGHTFESHNVIIELKEEVEIERMYGKKEYARSIGLMIDDKQRLKERWEEKI